MEAPNPGGQAAHLHEQKPHACARGHSGARAPTFSPQTSDRWPCSLALYCSGARTSRCRMVRSRLPLLSTCEPHAMHPTRALRAFGWRGALWVGGPQHLANLLLLFWLTFEPGNHTWEAMGGRASKLFFRAISPVQQCSLAPAPNPTLAPPTPDSAQPPPLPVPLHRAHQPHARRIPYLHLAAAAAHAEVGATLRPGHAAHGVARHHIAQLGHLQQPGGACTAYAPTPQCGPCASVYVCVCALVCVHVCECECVCECVYVRVCVCG